MEHGRPISRYSLYMFTAVCAGPSLNYFKNFWHCNYLQNFEFFLPVSVPDVLPPELQLRALNFLNLSSNFLLRSTPCTLCVHHCDSGTMSPSIAPPFPLPGLEPFVMGRPKCLLREDDDVISSFSSYFADKPMESSLQDVMQTCNNLRLLGCRHDGDLLTRLHDIMKKELDDKVSSPVHRGT